MSRPFSRRSFLRVCAVGAAAGSGVAAGEAVDDLAAAGSLQSEDTVADLQADLERKRRRRRERRSTMRPDRKEQARQVGLAARPGVVVLESGPGNLATGWAVESGRLLTAGHAVTAVGQTIDCWTLAGEPFEATVAGLVSDLSPDVALLETDRELSTLETGSASSLEDDDTLVQVGHPAHFGYWVLAAGPYRGPSTAETFASEVPILVGNSGSPVLDLEGRVVGLSSSSDMDPEQREAWGEPFRDETVLHEPVRPQITTYHVPIESALDRLEGWT